MSLVPKNPLVAVSLLGILVAVAATATLATPGLLAESPATPQQATAAPASTASPSVANDPAPTAPAWHEDDAHEWGDGD